jgi:hypothetical protein
MNRLFSVVLCLSLAVGYALPAAATSSDSVGLGVSVGVAMPEGQLDEAKFDIDDWDPSFNWGFYVNIPLVYTFHIMPSAELYKVGGQNATDISLAFKFIFNLWAIDLYAGVVPGLTAINDIAAFNVGGLVGLSFNLFANLDMFVQAKYKVVIHGDRNSRILHANAGVLFTF